MEPPDYIDEAKVLMWAWSGEQPFGFVGEEGNLARETIFGLTIWKYENGRGIYRFSCNRDWETVQDSFHDTIDNAIKQLPAQYKNVEANWQLKED